MRKLVGQEIDIWNSAYTAAFVDQFRAARDAGALFDNALDANVETAITVADAAVQQLREWRRDENEYAGIKA